MYHSVLGKLVKLINKQSSFSYLFLALTNGFKLNNFSFQTLAKKGENANPWPFTPGSTYYNVSGTCITQTAKYVYTFKYTTKQGCLPWYINIAYLFFICLLSLCNAWKLKLIKRIRKKKCNTLSKVPFVTSNWKTRECMDR